MGICSPGMEHCHHVIKPYKMVGEVEQFVVVSASFDSDDDDNPEKNPRPEEDDCRAEGVIS